MMGRWGGSFSSSKKMICNDITFDEDGVAHGDHADAHPAYRHDLHMLAVYVSA